MNRRKFGVVMLLSTSILLAACSQTNQTKDTTDTVTSATSTTGNETSGKSTKTETAQTPEQDYYHYVNAEWLKENPIPKGQSSWGAIEVMNKTMTDNMKQDFNAMAKGEKEVPAELTNFINYYRMANDFDTREKNGTTELREHLKTVEGISSIEELKNQAADLILDGWIFPFDLYISKDSKEANKNAFFADSSPLFLGDVSSYKKGSPEGEGMREQLEQTFTKLLTLTGYSDNETKDLIKKGMDFDAAAAKHQYTAEEKQDLEKTYNPVSVADFNGFNEQLGLGGIVESLTGTTPEKVVIDNPAYFKNLDALVTADKLEELKAWMILHDVLNSSILLTQEMAETGGMFASMANGMLPADSKEDGAYAATTKIYNQPTGMYYGKTYLGAEQKADVEQMVHDSIAVYKDRMAKNDWLGKETREKAIKKLDTMAVRVGYPEKISAAYDKLVVTPATDGGTFYNNAKNLGKITKENDFARLNEVPGADKDIWQGITGSTLNAFYKPEDNSINFPAAMLQAPFYSGNPADKSENYGGIGSVIGHEISHAFDSNGSKYDENGIMTDWWTKEDKKAFDERIAAMVKLFDGREVEGNKINGKLTVTENTADAGGLSNALELTSRLDNPDYEAFYRSYAAIQRENDTKETLKQNVETDPHAPNQARANVQLGNLDKFYDTYNVKKGDGMYIAPEDRVKIW